MKPTFGPGGNSLSFYSDGKKNTSEAPEWVKSKGLDSYEYQAGRGVYGSDENFITIGKNAAKSGIKLSVHAPYFISLSGIVEEKRLKSLDYIRDSIHAAELMGAYLIVIHTGSASKISREEAVYLAKDTMSKALEAFPDTKVIMGLETMGKLKQLGTLEEVVDICSIDKRLHPVVDFGHMNARNIGGYYSSADDYRRTFDYIGEKLGKEYATKLHCHFSKIEYTSSGEKKHLTFDDTTFGPDFEPLMEAIYKDSLSPNIICESDGTMAEDALKMKQYYEKLVK